jgi:hypothetical protein
MGAGAPDQKSSADSFSQLNPGQPAIPLIKHIKHQYKKKFKRKIEKFNMEPF